MKDPLTDFRPGDEITVGIMEALIAEVRRWRKAHASPPLNLDYADGSGDEPPAFWVDADDGGLIPAQTGSGSTASGASSTVTLYYNSSGTLTLGSDTVTAINPYSATIPASTLVWITYFQGAWWIVAADCSS